MYKRILVPLDGSRTSRLGLAEAIRMAKSQGSELNLLHVVDELVLVSSPEAPVEIGDLIDVLKQDGRKILDDGAAAARKQGVKAQTTLIETFGGRAADTIVGEAKKWRASLIVLGTHGRRGMKRVVMGSDCRGSGAQRAGTGAAGALWPGTATRPARPVTASRFAGDGRPAPLANAAAAALRRLVAAAALLVLAAGAAAQGLPSPDEPQFGESGKDVPWVPMPEAQVEKILSLAKVTPADVVMDLGSGDGRVVIAAAKRGARAVGVEFNPRLVAFSRREAQKAGVADRAIFEQGDLFDADLGRASVITLFLLESVNVKLQPKLLALKPGTRIVANTFQIGNWQPDAYEHDLAGCDAWCTLYLWIVPARVAGNWKTPQGTLSLKQAFQTLSGSLGEGFLAVPVSGKLAGDEIRFSAGGSEYRGRVTADAIEGTVTTSAAIRPWRAGR